MTEAQIHGWLVLLSFALSAQSFILLMVVNAPYGRFERPGWGPAISTRSAWIIFESPAVVVFAAIYFAGDHAFATTPLVLFGIWQFHYIIRTFIFPFRIRETGKRIPVLIVFLAILFNLLNAYVNARWISQFGSYPVTWLTSIPFIAGSLCMAAGWVINQHADLVLFRLRKPGDATYGLPRGGMYRWISCPNYFGEMLMWCGWAIATWSLAGLSFAVMSASNLLPRAIAIHDWYQDRFDDYPAARKAVIPYLV